MKATVNKATCEGHGLCMSEAFELFDIGTDGRAYVLEAEVPPELEAQARAAQGACPTKSISIQG